MLYLDIDSNNNIKAIQPTKYLLLVLLCLAIWFLPATQEICKTIDLKFFRFLNNSLKYSDTWATFWAYLNHKNETYLNLIFLIGINICSIFSQPKFRRLQAFSYILYFWLAFQGVLILNHFIIRDILDIQRLSPSIATLSVLNLSDYLNIPNLKITSSDCFPAGHALVLIYWAKFSMRYSKPWLQRVIIALAMVLIFPRLFSGAHWLSDVLFTICYSMFWFELAANTRLFYLNKKLESFLRTLFPQKRQEGSI